MCDGVCVSAATPFMATATETEASIQQMQLQQQHVILQQQQLLEKQQQKEQQQQLLAMSHNLQQSLQQHKRPVHHSVSSTPSPSTPSTYTTTQTPAMETSEQESTTSFVFPINLSGSFEASTTDKVTQHIAQRRAPGACA